MYLEETGTDEDYASCGIRRNAEGEWSHLREDVSADKVTSLVERGVALVRGAAQRATTQWWDDCESLPEFFTELPQLPEIRSTLSSPAWPEDAEFAQKQRVEIWHRGAWYPATVTAAHEDGTFSVVFEEGGRWGSGTQVLPERLRHLSQ